MAGLEMSPSPWRWVVLAAAFLSLLITGFSSYNAGMLYVLLLQTPGVDPAVVTWLASYYAGAFALTAPFASVFINVTNCRTCVALSGILCLAGFAFSSVITDVRYLFATLSLVGLGQAMSNTGSMVAVSYYFRDKMSIASGVCQAGGALSIFVHPPLLQELARVYGLSGALLLSGAIAFHSSICGALMRPTGMEESRHRTSPRPSNPLHCLCRWLGEAGHDVGYVTSPPMLCIVTSVFVFSIAYFSLIVLLPGYLVEGSGLTATEASLVISMCGLGSFVSRIASGFLAHEPRVGSLVVYVGLLGVLGAATLLAPVLRHHGTLGCYTLGLVVGVYSGGGFSTIFPVLYGLVGVRRSAAAFGLAFFMMGLGGMFGAPLTDLVISTNSNELFRFGFLGCLFWMAAALAAMSAVFPVGAADEDKPPVLTRDEVTSAGLDTGGWSEHYNGGWAEQDKALTSSRWGGRAGAEELQVFVPIATGAHELTCGGDLDDSQDVDVGDMENAPFHQCVGVGDIDNAPVHQCVGVGDMENAPLHRCVGVGDMENAPLHQCVGEIKNIDQCDKIELFDT